MAEKEKFILCPYCGHMQPGEDSRRCDECGGLFEPLSRRATQIAMGPWYIRDKSKPFRPGCSYEVLHRQIKAGRIKPTSILRGPTTRQFWSVARNVPGVSHLLGYCHRCGAHVKPTDTTCSECGEPFVAVNERNELGLLYPTGKEAAAAMRALERERTGQPAPSTTPAAAPAAPASPRNEDRRPQEQASGDLLSRVLGTSVATPASVGAAASGSAGASGGSGSPLLQFERPDASAQAPAPASEGDAQVTQAPPPTGEVAVEALDFTPTDDEDEPTINSGTKLVTWVLIIVNLIALALLAIFVTYFVSQEGSTSATGVGEPGLSDRAPADDPDDRSSRYTGWYEDGGRKRTPRRPDRDGPIDQTDARPPLPDRTPSGDESTNGDDKDIGPSPASTYEEQFRNARKLADERRYDPAIEVLEQIRDTSDDPDVDDRANDEIERLLGEQRREEETPSFFGIPMTRD